LLVGGFPSTIRPDRQVSQQSRDETVPVRMSAAGEIDERSVDLSHHQGALRSDDILSPALPPGGVSAATSCRFC